MKAKEIDRAEFSFPILRPHCGVPLGNGMLGALVWGDDRLNITLNRSDFWDHRGGQCVEEGETYRKMKAAFDPDDPGKLQAVFRSRARASAQYLNPTRLPAGRFEFRLKPGCRLIRACLDMAAGRLAMDVE